MKYTNVHTKRIIYIQIHKNQSVAINLLKVSIFDLVKQSIVYISHFVNMGIYSVLK